jgi:hypothetical protein
LQDIGEPRPWPLSASPTRNVSSHSIR